ncbi:MAG: YgiQ family radical SAM protein [bacterium]|nr:YgiQ family radical SAM protein [bacterium]
MKDKFLPTSKEDLKERGWKELDIILVSGDAYVDHPTYGTALIGRFLESKGFKVGVIAQPDWKNKEDFARLGKPRLFFGVTAGNIDSMIANYTANKKIRHNDDYSPGGKAGFRPDRATVVYTNRLRELFGDVPVILGGIEASLRRVAHYDYWDNKVRRSILLDSKADILVYGMGERQVWEIAERLKQGEKVKDLDNIRGTVVIRKNIDFIKECILLPSFEEVKENKEKFSEAFNICYQQMNPLTAKPLAQKYDQRFLIQFPPALPLSTKELDELYSLPFIHNWHYSYNKSGGIPGFEIVRCSITAHRGCCGECSFCSIYFHQGRIVQSRSMESILKEAALLSKKSDFKGTISDIGGPTANLYQAQCSLWQKNNFCSEQKCLIPQKCKNLKLGYKECLELYRKARAIPGIKHIFLGSGIRYDLLVEDEALDYFEEICRFHVSGQMKVAPEHIDDNVLKIMNKPPLSVYEKFTGIFNQIKKKIEKDIFVVNYFITSHPGTSLKEAEELREYLLEKHIRPEQIQDFTPSPSTLSTCIYWTEKHPFTGEKVYVPKTFAERKQQRDFIQPPKKYF